MIVLGVPTMGTIPVKVIGCIDNVLLTRKDVIPFYVEGSLVYDARAKIVNYALEKDADLFFLDSDICFPIEGYDRLIARNKDIVSGLYYGRNKMAEPVAYKKVQPKSILHRRACVQRIDLPAPELSEVAAVGLGFCFIRNNVLRALPTNINPFEPFGNLGEDFSFLLRCRRKGFKVYLDSSFELKHLGEYDFTFRDYEARQRVSVPDSL